MHKTFKTISMALLAALIVVSANMTVRAQDVLQACSGGLARDLLVGK